MCETRFAKSILASYAVLQLTTNTYQPLSATIFVARLTQLCTVKLARPFFRVWVRKTTAATPRGKMNHLLQ